ncbi:MULTISPECIES: DUF1804 family protein [unclassified Pseudovibrio]|uniref:DUF1804 family protein n=1 Tax=unclassified Pseudovibrio TaxID=2627060 RepID=UPI0007AE775B|nr:MULTISPECIES: DUF1804 family protein [unclassified Pseudovibrio]KZK97300.1 hypothetical protein PsW74_03740 [Pseudovibrio sp. W74]KZL05533.1 hypothetical protein PsAD26_04330 [Pseudovibrio sp. Ad26]KZL08986.1 hypothetical protein PsAD14_02565 [Pseudovibrio sp. Ad14]
MSKKPSKADQKRLARRLFVLDRQAIPTVAVSIGVSESTLRRWKKDAATSGDNWDAARSANALAGEGLEAVVATVVEDFVSMFQATIEQIKVSETIEPPEKVKLMASLSDAFNKMVASAGRVAPKLSELGVAQDVLQRFAEFIRKHHPDHAQTFLEVLEPFGEYLAEVYG